MWSQNDMAMMSYFLNCDKINVIVWLTAGHGQWRREVFFFCEAVSVNRKKTNHGPSTEKLRIVTRTIHVYPSAFFAFFFIIAYLTIEYYPLAEFGYEANSSVGYSFTQPWATGLKR